MLRVLALLVLADLGLRRLNGAVLGLRLSTEHPLLEAMNERVTPFGPHIQDGLLLGSILACAFMGVQFWRWGGVLFRALSLALVVGAAAALLGRLGPPGTAAAPAWALLAFGAAVLCLRHRPLLCLPLVGSALCTFWLILVHRVDASFTALDRVAEVTLLVGLAAPALPAILRQRNRLPALVLGATVALLILLGFWLNQPAWTHVVRHLFYVHVAGLPPTLVLILVVTAVAAIAALIPHRATRPLALPLLFILASARGPDDALIPLRIASAGALVIFSGAPRR
jgi:hypothetical protein